MPKTGEHFHDCRSFFFYTCAPRSRAQRCKRGFLLARDYYAADCEVVHVTPHAAVMAQSPRAVGKDALAQARQMLAARHEPDHLHKAFAHFERSHAVYSDILENPPSSSHKATASAAVNEINEELASIAFRFRQNPFLALQMNPSDEKAAVKKSYFKLARKYHPDKNQHTKQLFVQVHEAYEHLRDDAKLRNTFSRLKHVARHHQPQRRPQPRPQPKATRPQPQHARQAPKTASASSSNQNRQGSRSPRTWKNSQQQYEEFMRREWQRSASAARSKKAHTRPSPEPGTAEYPWTAEARQRAAHEQPGSQR